MKMKNGKTIAFILYKIRNRRWTFSIILVIALSVLCGWIVVRKGKKYHPDQDTLEGFLSYIRHPPVLCEEALTVGGEPYADKKFGNDKVICLKPGPGLRKNCSVYSFGVSNMWSFEEAMERYGCQVYTFDPSKNENDHQHSPRIWFYRLGISSTNENRNIFEKQATWKLRTLDYILEMLGHTSEPIDVFKIDIGGSEWDVLEHLLDHKHLNHIYHLCVKAHLDLDKWKIKSEVLHRLEDEAKLRFFSSRENAPLSTLIPRTEGRKGHIVYELAWYRDK